MPRETFQQELDDLVVAVLDLGTEVEGSLENMVRAMENRDASIAEKELGVDVRYKARGAEIESDCMILQARQAPVARDLRLLYTVQSVTNHLVRSGTLTEHICHAIVDTARSERDENLVANPSAGGAGAPEWRMRAALIVHYLERIADHGVDIGACTVFLVTGERIEDAMRQYLQRNIGEE